MPGGFDAVQDRHADIEQHQIGKRILHNLKEIAPIAYGVHELKLIFQQLSQALRHQRVVLGNNHSSSIIHRCLDMSAGLVFHNKCCRVPGQREKNTDIQVGTMDVPRPKSCIWNV